MENRAVNIWFDGQRVFAESHYGRVVGMPLSWVSQIKKSK